MRSVLTILSVVAVGLLGTPTAGQDEPAGESKSNGLPALVQRQSEGFQTAWLDLMEAFAENAKLEQPLPDPYFSRGEMWMQAGDADAALRDYLEAARIANQSGRDPSTLRSYYDKLRVALQEVNRNPRPIAPGEAAEHFSRGVHAFRGDKL
ncbi:MAG: hypothetical protein N2C14_03880, partial [Planctomycetales bacterium]